MGGTSIGSMEVKLKDYLDGATVLFDAAGNVVDGRLQSDYSPWVISPEGVEVSFTWSDLSNKKFVGVGFTQERSSPLYLLKGINGQD